MFKIKLKSITSLCNICLLIFFIITLFIGNINCGIIRREIPLKNETSEIESNILQQQKQLQTTIATTTTTEIPKQFLNDTQVIGVKQNKKEDDASNFRTEITTISETRSESFSIATKTPKIIPSKTNKINLINETIIDIDTTTTHPIIATTTTTEIQIPNNVNLNVNTEAPVNITNTKENLAKSLETTESILNIVQTTTQIIDEADTTTKQDLFRDDSQINIEFTTEPQEFVTKIFDEIDYDDSKITSTTTTATTIENQNKFETNITKSSKIQQEIDKEIIIENENLKEKIRNETKNSSRPKTEDKISKLELKSKNFKSNILNDKIENELSPLKSEKNDIKIEGRSHHINKYDDILAEIDSGEKQSENNIKILKQQSINNKESTTISNDLEIPNTAELWALVGMKKNLQKEKLTKLENTTTDTIKIESTTPEYLINIEQDNTTLKHLTDWSKIMEDSIDMENSTSIIDELLLVTTSLPDIEENNKISINSITNNNINENSDKENIINSNLTKSVPTIIATTTTTPTITTEEITEMKMNLNSSTPANETKILQQQKTLNNSSESVSLNEEKSLLKLTQVNNSDDKQNKIKENIIKNQENNDDKILTFLNASSVNNLDLKNNHKNETTPTPTTTTNNNNDDEVDLNLLFQPNTTTTTTENIKFSEMNSSILSSSPSSSSPSSIIPNKTDTTELSSQLITTTPPTIPTITTTTTSHINIITTMRGLPLKNSSKAHPNKEDVINDLNTVILNNAFKNNSSEQYLENFQNYSLQQQQEQNKTILNRNSNLTDDEIISKLSTAVENSLNNKNINETNSIPVNLNENNNNSKSIEIKEDLLNKINLTTNESYIKNDIITKIITTEKNKQDILVEEQEQEQEQKMTSRMDYDDENNLTTTEIYFDKLFNKNQKYQTVSTTEIPLISTTDNEIIKKKSTTEKMEKSEIVKSTSESSIENDIIEKHQSPTTKSSLFPKLIQPTTLNPLKVQNNDEEIIENSLDVQSTLQTIPFGKDPSDILIGSPSPTPSSELDINLYPKYEVATTSDTKLEIISIDNSTISGEDKNCDPSSTKIPHSVEGLEGAVNDTDYNVIIAVSVSVVGIIALILLVGFLIVMRKRQKQTTYSQRCRPVGLDAYSMDNISIRDSIRGKSFRNSVSKRTYGNVAFDDPSLIHNMMSIHELNRFIGKKSAIFDEFKDIPQITAKPDEVPPGCEDKNRYANVIPLPETRVILQQIDGDEKTEYINGNYVRGPKDPPNYYIACQAPLESTVSDFWRMIWEQNSRVIIMATDLEENGIEKSAAYIPESMTLDNHLVYGNYQITLKNREVKEKYAVSTLHVKNLKTNAWREITHFWYQWPVAGVPTDEAPMIAMLLEARSCLKSAASEQVDDEEIIEKVEKDKNTGGSDSNEINKNSGENGSVKNLQSNGNNKYEIKSKTLSKSQGPLLVHCSPGTGRTGTIIACDIAIRSLETPKRTVDIPQIVYYVRRGRASSIQTKEQYEFIYRVTHLYATKISAPVNDN